MPGGQKRFVFLVQGEGRGHMTQAIGLYQMLIEHGHEIVHVFIGKSDRREVPEYFFKSFGVPVEMLDSPNFVSDPDNKSIRLLPSILYNSKFLNRYKNSLNKIHQIIKHTNADGFINFYDFLGGFYNFFYKSGIKFFAVGHQFLTDHPSFPFAQGKPVDKKLFLINNYLNSINAHKKLALSFTEYNPDHVGRTVVVPPLLRKDISSLRTSDENFILGYMVNDGYSQEIINWHKQNPEITLRCFWDKKNEPKIKEIDVNLIFYQLNAKMFLDMMARCKGLITTAGFETVCEAMYLGKPVLMVPVSGQYEQACNALDAANAGAGIHENYFNISRFLNFIAAYKNTSIRFRQWISKAPQKIVDVLTDF